MKRHDSPRTAGSRRALAAGIRSWVAAHSDAVLFIGGTTLAGALIMLVLSTNLLPLPKILLVWCISSAPIGIAVGYVISVGR